MLSDVVCGEGGCSTSTDVIVAVAHVLAVVMFLLGRHVAVIVVVVGFLGLLISVVDHVVVVGVVAPASVLGSQVSRRWYSEIKLDFFTASQVRAA